MNARYQQEPGRKMLGCRIPGHFGRLVPSACAAPAGRGRIYHEAGSMAPHAQAARGAALYTPCGDELNNWPRGHPADGSDDDYGLKADGALSQKAAALLDACDAEPDGDRRLALARRAYAAAP